MIILLE